MAKRLEGVMVLIGTPLNKDYSLNEENLRREVDWCVQSGADGIWTVGYFGEYTVLDEETRKRVNEICIDQAKGRLYCVAGCHGISTLQCIRLAKHAESVGCDAAWVAPLTPRRATDDEVYEFYKMIVDNTQIPIVAYSSHFTGVYMRPPLIAKIAAMDRVVGIKDTIRDFSHIVSLYNLGVHKNIKIFTVLPLLLHLILGGAGCTCYPARLHLSKHLYDAFKRGDMNEAWELQKRLIASWPGLFVDQIAEMTFGAKIEHSIEGWSKAQNSMAMGIDLGPPMHPYAPASEALLKKAKEDIEKYLF